MSSNGMQATIEQDELENETVTPYEYYVDSDGRYCFRTSDGTVLYLKGIAQVIYQRFVDAWKYSNPQPKPPEHEIKRAKKMVWVPNPNDEYFKMEIGNWNQEMAMAVSDFMITRVVQNETPDDFEVDEEIAALYGEVSPKKRKIMWVETLMATNDEQERFVEAAMSITMPTESGIKQSTARFPSNSE